jgi:hypothetical protein
MMPSVSLPTEMQTGAIQKAIPMPTRTQAIRKPGKSGPAVFAFCDPGPSLRDFTKKNLLERQNPLPQANNLAHAQRVLRSRFLRSQPRRIGPGSAHWARPDTQTFTISRSFRIHSAGTGIFLQARNSFLNERTCRINLRQVKQN